MDLLPSILQQKVGQVQLRQLLSLRKWFSGHWNISTVDLGSLDVDGLFWSIHMDQFYFKIKRNNMFISIPLNQCFLPFLVL